MRLRDWRGITILLLKLKDMNRTYYKGTVLGLRGLLLPVLWIWIDFGQPMNRTYIGTVYELRGLFRPTLSIRIDFGRLDPDPGGQKWATKNEKKGRKSMFWQVLDVQC